MGTIAVLGSMGESLGRVARVRLLLRRRPTAAALLSFLLLGLLLTACAPLVPLLRLGLDTDDAYHRVQMAPDGDEIVRALDTAIGRSGRCRQDIGYINYHGTSTVLNDIVEIRSVRRVFGAGAERIPGSSVKSMIGHPQGASGAAGIVTAAMAIDRGFLPPTINQHDLDPACDLDVIPNTGRPAQIEAALCNCLGFGSKNSAIVIGRVA